MVDQAAELVAKILGSLPSGCSILTATHAGRSSGMLTSWIQQASFEPLLLTVAIKQGRPILDLIEKSRRFVLNLLGSDPDKLLRHFASGFGLGEPAFEGLSCRHTQHGVVVDDALGYLECDVWTTVRTGDHDLFIAQAVSAGSGVHGAPYVHIRKTALKY